MNPLPPSLRTFLLLCLPAAHLLAQAAAPTPAAAQFADEPYVIQSASTVISMQPDGTGTRVQTNTILFHSDSAVRQLSVLSIAYASFSERADFVFVRVIHPDGTTQETPVSSAIDQAAPVTQQAPFYSDIKLKQIPIRSLRTGDTLEWQARFTIEHPEAPGQFWYQQAFLRGPVVRSEDIELRLPATLHPTVWLNPRAQATLAESTADGQHVYRWHHADLHPTVGPEAEARKKAELTRLRTPEEEIDIQKGELPSVAWSTFPDWAAVGAWYRTLTADRIAPDAAIKAKVAELTAGKSSDLARAQAVYTYVSTQIRYIGVAFGIGRYQPHPAAEIFANQYGDCKDKHTLLASMLSVLNLHADPVLVGAGIRFNPAVPSPAAFNHLISRLSLNGGQAGAQNSAQTVWLDATAEVGAWGALLNVIRDQQALVVTAAPPAVLAQTPADLPHPQTATETVTGSLDDSLTSDSTITFTLHDDAELYLRAVLHNVSPADYGVFAQQFVNNLGFGGTTSDPSIVHLEDPAQPLQISFHYHRVKEKDWGDNRITAIFQPIGLPYYKPEEPPVSAIQLGAPRIETSHVEMQLPKGWTVSPPEDVHAHTPFVDCDITYHLGDGKLIAERRLTVRQKQIPASSFKQYQSWVDEADPNSVPYIQLLPHPKDVTIATAATPKPSEKSPGATPTVHPDDPHAAELITKAFASLRSLDLDSARKSLDEANAINPTQHGLWTGYAAISGALGKTTEAIANMQHELTLHPDEVELYPRLARAESQAGDRSAALALLHAWVKAAPDSPAAALALASGLQSMKRNDEALKEAQSAITRLEPAKVDLTDLRIVAANAHIALGHPKEAADLVAPLLADTTELYRINNIAYVLAQTGVHLTDAETAQDKALAQLEQQTADWTLTANLGPILGKEVQLAADWDTMAWILYQEGKYPQALAYIQAAASTADHQDFHEHLAAIDTALHRPEPGKESGLKLRTIPLGPANGRRGVASFTLLMADGKVIDSAPSHDSSASAPTLPHSEDLLKLADLHTLFPPNSKAHLIRNASLNCHADTCELILAPLQ